MTTATPAADEGRVVLVMTRTYPGGWARGEDGSEAQLKDALRRLRGDWSREVREYGYAVFMVHPETRMNELGNFVHPVGAPPTKVKEVGGTNPKSKPKVG
jgi:hypothetical protein